MVEKSERLPLEGLKILDISTMIAAPWASTYLADFGATVIKVEHPQYGDHVRNFGSKKGDIPLFWKTLNRNKTDITLNLSKPEGQKVFKELIMKVDVVVENFKPGTLEKWDLGWETLSKINSSLVMLRTTGYGQTGPYSTQGGFGTVAEAMSGFASVNGTKGGPPTLPGIPLADGVASVFGALSIMIAIYEKEHNLDGKGQCIDMSIYEPLMRFMEPHIMNYNQLGTIADRMGNASLTSAPRNAYQTSQGSWVALSGAAQSVTEKLFKAIDREDLIKDERFSNNINRMQNVSELDGIIGAWIKERTTEEVVSRFNECGAVIGPMYDVKQLFEDPHFKHRESFVTVKDEDLGDVKIPNVFAKFSKTPGKVKTTGPQKGEHNQKIYKELLGFSDEKIKELQDDGVI
ncbi:CaiB/BaiF CoA transferase family protein [Planococcus faecalis]|uniref:CaiB/BaiF CoA transferase family protein n=1 Tax=Planococcus faecalis TaxID=1598147 RepID=UPI0008D8D6C6|nr:CoA transferase [Planococcus faecalis]OHX51629.1 acyl-CoA transferase [Planococcus faecalis]